MRKNVVILFSILIVTTGIAQEKSNLQNFTPSILFKKGDYEILDYYNLYTQNSVRDRNGDIQSLGERQTFINGIYQFTYGVSNTGRINIGADLFVSSVLYDDRDKSPFNALLFKPGNYNRIAVTAIGPRVKVNPISSLPTFSIQSSILFPIAKDLETGKDEANPRFTGHDRYTWNTQLFYDKSFGENFLLFFEVDFLYRLARDSEKQVNFFRVPLSIFASYFPSIRFTLFTFAQYSPRFEKVSNGFDEQFGLSQRFTQVGAGVKYQYSTKMGLELSYSKFVNSRLDGNGYSLNFGIRIIKRK